MLKSLRALILTSAALATAINAQGATAFQLITDYLHAQTDTVWGTEEIWYNKFIRVSVTNDADIYFETNAAGDRVYVRNVMEGLTDFVFYQYAATPAPGVICLADQAQYTFTLEDGTTKTLWAQKIERPTYDCYTVPYYQDITGSNGTNRGPGSNSSFTASASKDVTFTDQRDIVIYSERTGYDYLICPKGSLTVTRSMHYHGQAFRSVVMNTRVTDKFTEVGEDMVRRNYHIQCVTKDTTRTSVPRYPDYNGNMNFVNFNNKGRAYSIAWQHGNNSAGITGDIWWTKIQHTRGGWGIRDRSCFLYKQYRRANVVEPDPLSDHSVAQVGLPQRYDGWLTFRDLLHSDPEGTYTTTSTGAATGKPPYWYITPVGGWGQITTGLMNCHFNQYLIEEHHPTYELLMETADSVKIYTLYRANITPWVPMTVNSYGYGEIYEGSGTYIYANISLDMDEAYNADILDHCDLYIVPGNYTRAPASNNAAWANLDLGNDLGMRLSGVPEYVTEFAGTTSVDGVTVDPYNDATHYNVLFPLSDLPALSTDNIYSFYLKAHFKPEYNITPVFMALTPRTASQVTTGLSDIAIEPVGDTRYYDLQGRTVAHPTPGQLVIAVNARGATKQVY